MHITVKTARAPFYAQLGVAKPLTDIEARKILNDLTRVMYSDIKEGDIALYAIIKVNMGVDEKGIEHISCFVRVLAERNIDKFLTEHEYSHMAGNTPVFNQL